MNYVEYEEKMLQSFEYETTVVNDTNKEILGTCELGKATIQMINEENNYSSFKGSWLKTIHGSFYIYDVAPVQEKVNIRLDCYDIKYKLDTPYDSSKHTFPCTLKEWRNSIFDDCGVTYDNSDFPHSNLLLNKEPYVGKNPSNRNVIALIAKAGCSLIITEKDKFYFTWFEDTVFTADDWLELTTEKEYTRPVECVVLGRGTVEDNVKYPLEDLDESMEFRIDNSYILDPQDTNNIEDKRYENIIPIYNRVKGFSYIEFSMRTQFIKNKLSLRLGQKIKYLDTYDNELQSYVMSKKIVWLGGNLEDDNNYEVTLSAVAIKETSTELSYASNIQEEMIEAQRMIDKVEGIIKDFSKKITDLLDYIKISSKKGDNIKLENTPESHGAINKLNISGFKLQKLYPNMTYPSNFTKLNVLNFYTLIFSNEEVIYSANLPPANSEFENKIYNVKGVDGGYYRCVNNNNEFKWIEATDFEYQEVYINSPIALQTVELNNVIYSDEILIENNNVTVIQNVSKDGKNKLIYPKKYDLGPFTIPTFEENTYVTLKYFKDLKYQAEYLIKNEFTSIFATQVETIAEMQIMANQIALKVTQAEMSAAIQMAVNEINLEVSKKINDIDVVARINLSDGIINLEGDRLIIDTNNLKISKDSILECVKGIFTDVTIKGGKIELQNGATIVGDNGLLTNLQFQTFGNYMGKSLVGFVYDSFSTGQIIKTCLPIIVKVPENFTVVHAYVSIDHSRVNFANATLNASYVGAAKNVKLYKAQTTNTLAIKSDEYATSASLDFGILSGTEITGAFGDNGYTANNIYSDSNEVVKSNDIGSSITTGNNILFIATAENTTSSVTNMRDANSKTGAIQLTVDVIGYTNFK